MSEFKIGDKVVIKDIGKQYTTYQSWAEDYSLKHFKYGHTAKLGESGRIVAIEKQSIRKNTMYGIALENGIDIIIGDTGVREPGLSDILKPWQRVRVANGGLYIVSTNVHNSYEARGSLVLVNPTNGFIYLDTATREDTQWSIVEVFEPPSSNSRMLDPESCGASIWKETPPETETQKAMKALEATIKESQEKLDSLKKTLQ